MPDIKDRIKKTLDESPVRDEPRHLSPRSDREGDVTPDPRTSKKAPQYVVATLSSHAGVSKETARSFLRFVYDQGLSAAEAAEEMGLQVGTAFDLRDAMNDLDIDPDEYREMYAEEGNELSREKKFERWKRSGRIPADERADRDARLSEILDEVLASTVESAEDLEVAGKRFVELSMLAEHDRKALQFGSTLWEAMKVHARQVIDEEPGDDERPISERVDADDDNPFDGWGEMSDYLEGDAVEGIIERDAVQIAEVYARALTDLHEDADNISAQLDEGDLLFNFGDPVGDAQSAIVRGTTESGRNVALKVDVSELEHDNPYLAFYVQDTDSHVVMRLFESNWMATLTLLMQHSLKAMQAPGYTYSEMQNAEAPAYTRDMR